MFIDEKLRISVSSTPCEFNIKEKVEYLQENIIHVELYFAIGTILPFLVSSFISFPITDRVSHMKSMQHMAGVSIWMYWIINFIWDFLNYTVIVTIICLPLPFLYIEGLNMTEYILVWMTIVVYGLFALPFVYCLSLCFSDAIVGYFATAAIFISTGNYSIIVAISMFKSRYSNFYEYMIHTPQFGLIGTIMHIHNKGLTKEYCDQEVEYLEVTKSFVCDSDTGSACCGKFVIQKRFDIH